MSTRKAIIGDIQGITIDFDGAAVGEVYEVDVHIKRPDGIINSYSYRYKFYKPVTRKSAPPVSNVGDK